MSVRKPAAPRRLPKAIPFIPAAGDAPGTTEVNAPVARPNPQLEFELALMAALGLEGRADVLRMTLDVSAGQTTATVVLAAPVLSRAALAGEIPPHVLRFKLVPAGDV